MGRRGCILIVLAALLISGKVPTADQPAAKEPIGIITTVAGGGDTEEIGDGGLATKAILREPKGVAVGPDGALYIADTGNNRIRKVDPTGIITTVAGEGSKGFFGDGGPGTKARLNAPWGLAVGADGLYVADSGNHCIRKVTRSRITTVAGIGRTGYEGDGGLATEARLCEPKGVTISPDGSIYIADTGNHRIRKVDRTGIIATVAGNGNDHSKHGDIGDGGPATKAYLSAPMSVAVRRDGALYIADPGQNDIRLVQLNGMISTASGGGFPIDEGGNGDSGPFDEAVLWQPSGLDMRPDGSLFISDTRDNRIRKVDSNGTITTVVGDSIQGYSGDGARATEARLSEPVGIAVGPDGSLYIADSGNNRIRKVTLKKQ